MSFDRLIAKIIETKNPTVAGLDPKLDYIPVYIKEESYANMARILRVQQMLSSHSTRLLLMLFAI